MTSNRRIALGNAKRTKYDEFYTRYEDIERTIRPFHHRLEGKHVYCNCDDPSKSNYVKYFLDNFIDIGLRKLSATYYDENVTYLWTYKMDEAGNIIGKKKRLDGDGSYDSEECMKVLRKCDVVITNPPFSLLNRYVKTILESGKDFILIAPLTALTYTTFRSNLSCNGGRIHPTGMKVNRFITEDDYERYDMIDDDGRKIKGVSTTIVTSYDDVDMRTDIKNIGKTEFDRIDGTDIVNIDSLSDIWRAAGEVLAVPITLLSWFRFEDCFDYVGIYDSPNVKGINKFKRVIIAKKAR